MRDLTEAVQEYIGSEYYLFLDPSQKEHAESLLSYCCDKIGDEVSQETLDQAFRAIGNLDAPIEARKGFPSVLQAFFDYLSNTGGIPAAAEWAHWISELEPVYLERFRDDGSMRGDTVRKVLPKIGRNDPCPCGSGEKYKKCCFGLFG